MRLKQQLRGHSSQVVISGLVGLGGALVGGFAVLALRRHDSDWAIVALTSALVAVTTAYVVLTWKLMKETRLARLEEQQRWQLGRLHLPARAALDLVRQAQDDLKNDAHYKMHAGRFASGLNEHIPFLEESEIRGRVEFCKEVARVSTFPDSEFGNVGLAHLAARHVRDVTRWSLEAYLADRPLPDWVDGIGAPLPLEDRSTYFPWLINYSKGGAAPPPEQ